MLAVSQRLGTLSDVITLDLPSALSPRIQNALKADPRTVELRAQATHFYGLGERVLGLFDEEVLADVLINVCVSIPFEATCDTDTNGDRRINSAPQRSQTWHIIRKVRSEGKQGHS
jgi:hypothetical protein